MSNSEQPTSGRGTNGLIILAVVLGLGGVAGYFGWRSVGTPGTQALDGVVLNSSTPSAATPSVDAPQGETPVAPTTEEASSVLATPPETAPQPQSDEASTDQTSDTPQSAEATDTPEDDPAPGGEVAEQATPAPSIEDIRQEADDITVFAGQAEPGSTVTILVDGQEVATAVADGRGDFAAVALLSSSAVPRVVTLMQGAGAAAISSTADIFLAPTPEPRVAEVEPTTAAPQGAEAQADAPAVADNSAVADPAEDTPEDTPVADAASAPASSEVDTAQSDAITDDSTASVAQIPPATVDEGAQTALSDTAPQASVDVAAPSGQIATGTAPAPSQADQAAPARAAVTVLKSSETGVELLQAPPAIGSVALDTIGYSETGDVQLSGRARVEAEEVRVYLNNTLVAQLDVGQDGRWRGDIPAVDAGIYTLRVDEVAADGAVSSRVETPFKREAPAVLSQANAGQGGPIKAITVQRGDTLWAIARDRYGEGPLYVRVFEANRAAIRDPDLIYPGQVFDLPD